MVTLSPTETLYVVLLAILVGVLFSLFGKKLHGKLKALETLISERLPAPQATAVNAVLETADRIMIQDAPPPNVTDLFGVLEKLVEIGVVNANVATVNKAKATGIFNAALGASVKQDVVKGVLDDLGGIKDLLAEHLGDVTNIVGKMVDKYVELNKA